MLTEPAYDKTPGGTLTFACYIGSLPTLIFNPPKIPPIFGIPQNIPVKDAIPNKKIPILCIATNDVDKNKQPNC